MLDCGFDRGVSNRRIDYKDASWPISGDYDCDYDYDYYYDYYYYYFYYYY